MQSDFYFINVAGKVSQNYCKHSEITIRQIFFSFFLMLIIRNYKLHQEEKPLI
jgi:hypothetical protein